MRQNALAIETAHVSLKELMKLPTKQVVEIDHIATGAMFRAARIKHRMSLREVSREVGVSAAYLSDLELGKRNWSDERMAKFQRAISLRRVED